MLFQALLRPGLLLWLFFVVVWLPGCTYFHNPQKAALAKDTADEFKKFQTSTASVNQAMLANLQKTEDLRIQRRAEMVADNEKRILNQVNALTWGEIRQEMESYLETRKNSDAGLASAVVELEKKLGTAQQSGRTAKTVLERAQTLLQNAINEQNLWEARRALLRASLSEIAQRAANSSDNNPNLKTAGDALNKVLQQNITVLNSNGVTTSEKSLQEVLKKDLTGVTPENFQDLFWKYTGAQFDPDKAPGLTIIILGLAVDLANARVARAQLDTDYLQQRITALKSGQAPVTNAEDALATLQFPVDERVLTTLNRLRRQNQAAELKAALETLSFYSLAKTQDEPRAHPGLKDALLEHEYSIRLSAIKGLEHEALISRGLKGLSVYHDGGIKPETIANFLRAAQNVALSIIAAGVI